MTIITQKHLVVFPSQLWGHARTMCTLAARIVKLRNIDVTFFTATSIYNRIKAEISRDFLLNQEHLMSRIRVIGLEESETSYDISGAELAFEAVWIKVLNKEPVICAKTGTHFEAFEALPNAVLLDLFNNHAFDIVKKLSPSSVKVWTWYPATVKSVMHIMGDDLEPIARAEADRRGVPYESVAYEMFMSSTGRVTKSPGSPPMHDYENHPQQFNMPKELPGRVLLKISGRVKKADGIITFDAAEYCPESTQALREWLAVTSRKAYFAGPLIPQVQEDTSSDPRSAKVLKFLDQKLASHGKHSVIYVSFGSLFWPADPAKLWAVLGVLMEKDIPFVMSCAAGFASAPPADFQDKLDQYGNAIMVNWVPQQALLDHPATGWYISHGGHNSTLETIMAGVPTIVWPIDADQPQNAIHLAEKLDVAYELIEVRNGTGAGKIYRSGRTPIATVEAAKDEMRDVLQKAFGEDGARKRANLQVVRAKLQTAWHEGGIAQRDVEAFVDDL